MNAALKTKLQANIWKSQLFQVLTGIVFFIPIIVLFWQENGLSLTQIMILQSLFSITIVLMEVPSGYVADLFGRRKSLIIASMFFIGGIAVYSVGGNFIQFLIAEMLWGLGLSFASGADSALLYDSLVDLKREKEFKKVWGNTLFFRLLGISFASIVGGFIAKLSFRHTFFFTLPFMLAMIPVTYSIVEPHRHKKLFKKDYVKQLLVVLKNAFVHNVQLRWIIIYAAVIYSLNQVVLWFYQPYFQLSGLDIVYFGLIFALFNIVAALSSKFAHRLEGRLGRKYSLIMLAVFVAGSYFLMGYFIYWFSFVFAFIQQFVRGFSKPVLEDYVHTLTTSDVRATVLSAQNLVGKLLYAIIIPFVGYIADIYSIPQALIIAGITATIITGFSLLVLKIDKVL